VRKETVFQAFLTVSFFGFAFGAGEAPKHNPTAQYNLGWTNEIRWSQVVNIKDFSGETWAVRLESAQQALAVKGGGIIYFPAGEYEFQEHLKLKNGIVLRGADPKEITDARRDVYNPPTRFEFPKYIPKLEGEGTPIDTAFKGIHLADPGMASNCGVVNIAINRGHINFKEAPGYTSGRNRIVYGCVLRNAAVADTVVPSSKIGQHAWQRFTARHHAAVAVRAEENILIANNRLPKSGEDNFTMNDYIVKGGTLDGVVFDYDNRPGLYINDYTLGGGGGRDPKGTPQTHPWGFRKGIVIRDNYLYMTGRCAISFTGDGTICADNVIRFEDNVWRPTTTGTNLTSGSATNDNRAVQMRGWRWRVEGNDYQVYRNLTAKKNYRINDGEGLMHEGHVNCVIRDSKLINNKGNSYLSLYKTAGVDGLLIQGNRIESRGIPAIYVNANRNWDKHFCRNVLIQNNITIGTGILIAGEPVENNLIKNNRHVGSEPGEIRNEANAKLENNQNYVPAQDKPKKKKK